MTVLSRAIWNASRLLSQNLGPLSSAMYHAADLYTKSDNNLNYDIKTNGEYRLLDKVSRFGARTIFDVGAN